MSVYSGHTGSQHLGTLGSIGKPAMKVTENDKRSGVWDDALLGILFELLMLS